MSVLRGRGASESFKEMREGLRRELQLVGDGLKREGRGKKEHLPDVGKEGGLDEVFGCLLCHAMGHLCQIAGAYPQLVGIVVDIVAVAALFFLQGEEFPDAHVHSARAEKMIERGEHRPSTAGRCRAASYPPLFSSVH